MLHLSRSFYSLYDEALQATSGDDSDDSPGAIEAVQPTIEFDIVIVGSGYGGSVAAARLGEAARSLCHSSDGRDLSILLLEKGREYLPGEFPETMAELPGHVRTHTARKTFDKGNANALYQVYASAESSAKPVFAVVANALGGGSQINANVAEALDAEFFAHDPWPEAIRKKPDEMATWYDRAREALVVSPVPDQGEPAGLQQFRDTAATLKGRMNPHEWTVEFKKPDLTVNFLANDSPYGAANPCIYCGNCVSGCNVDAKNTLTTTYLRQAHRAGVQMVTNAAVFSVESLDNDGYAITAIPTTQITAKSPASSLRILARYVILSAGSLGSTEILLRSAALRRCLSPTLGHRFSTNGDSISARTGMDKPSYPVGSGRRAASLSVDKRSGPTISGMVRIQQHQNDGLRPPRFYTVENASMPSPFTRLFGEVISTAALVQRLSAVEWSTVDSHTAHDPLAVDPAAIDRTAVFLTMSRDSGDGIIELVSDPNAPGIASGAASSPLEWSHAVIRAVPRAAKDGGKSHGEPSAQSGGNASTDEATDPLDLLDSWLTMPDQDGLYLPNPIRRPVPKGMADAMTGLSGLGGELTVHPLGGCAMGDHPETSVVNSFGQLHRFQSPAGCAPSRSNAFERLYVLDGSIIPVPLQTNPLLTITALAERACAHIIAEQLLQDDIFKERATQRPARSMPQGQLVTTQNSGNSPEITPRFVFRERLLATIEKPELAAVIQHLVPDDQQSDCMALDSLELILDLSYSPPDLDEFLRDRKHRADLAGELYLAVRNHDDLKPEEHWLIVEGSRYPIESGHLELFALRDYNVVSKAKAFSTFLWRRLYRDIALRGADGAPADASDNQTDESAGLVGIKQALSAFLNIAGHVGASRLADYDIRLRGQSGAALHLRGRKDIGYRYDSNVWRDLSEMSVQLNASGDRQAWCGKLHFDFPHFVRQGIPQILTQDNLPDSLEAISSFALFMLRMIASTYFWEFAAPDPEPDALLPHQLPGTLPLDRRSTRALEQSIAPQQVDPVHLWLHLDEGGDTAQGRGSVAASYAFIKRLKEDSSRQLWVSEQIINSARRENLDDGHHCLLTAYLHQDKREHPQAVLFHGYAMSSSMYTSSAVPVPLARVLFDSGFNVYVADTRTSFLLEKAVTNGVSYDRIARFDVPAIIHFITSWITDLSGRIADDSPLGDAARALHLINAMPEQPEARDGIRPVRVFAHCMGAAQFSMFCLHAVKPPPGETDPMYDPYKQFIASPDDRPVQLSLTRYIERAIFCQVSPFLIPQPGNSLRSELAALFDNYLPATILSPSQKSDGSFIRSMLERLMYTLAEFHPEEPLTPESNQPEPHLNFARRAFALYGRSWRQDNLLPMTQKRMHEIIGPVNLQTYRQVGYFADQGRVVDRNGRNEYLSDFDIPRAFQFPTAWIYAERSEMFREETMRNFAWRLSALSEFRKDNIRFDRLKEVGHLDCLIGKPALVTPFVDRVVRFFSGDNASFPVFGSLNHTRMQAASACLGPKALKPVPHAVRPDHQFVFVPARSGPFLGLTQKWNGRNHRRVCAQLESGRTQRSMYGVFSFVPVLNDAPQLERTQTYLVEPIVSLINGRQFIVADLPMGTGSPDEHLSDSSGFWIAGGIQELIVRDGDVITAVTDDIYPKGKRLANSYVDESRLSEYNIDRARWKKFQEAVMLYLSSYPPDPSSTSVNVPWCRENNAVTSAMAEQSFLFGSCLYPGLGVDRDQSRQTFSRVEAAVNAADGTTSSTNYQACLLLGDQIYADALGNAVSPSPSSTRLIPDYEQLHGINGEPASGLSGIAKRMPVLCFMDDHEHYDNFESHYRAGLLSDKEAADEAWRQFQWCSNPVFDTAPDPTGKPLVVSPPYFSVFELCRCPFFAFDMRSERDSVSRRLFGPLQRRKFSRWVEKVTVHPLFRDMPKFVLTGTPLAPVKHDTLTDRASARLDDSPHAFDADLAFILSKLIAHGADKTVFVSGDIHLSACVEGLLTGRPDQDPIRFANVTSSGLYAPMPFANAKPHEYAPDADHWDIGVTGMSYRTHWISGAPAIAKVSVSDSGDVVVSNIPIDGPSKPVTTRLFSGGDR